ncbi:MAG: nucleotide exchange factor GrpE [Desulfovibrionaceae bacterium]|nr:nucleotide exchange factor GrpE [Desulfovibrionaceae bacterium]
MTKKNPYETAQEAHSQAEWPNSPETEYEYIPPLAEPGTAFLKDPLPECPRCKATEEEAAKAIAEATDIRLRALADLDNARKRLLREKEEATRYAAAAVLTDILPALDNLDLALDHAKGSDACKDFLVGVEMTRKLLLESVKKHGLEPVGTLGEPFDPNLHEAISMTSHPDIPDGAICALLTRGYRLHDRLLRPAKVVVCKK